MSSTSYAVLGLGEAGRTFAAALAESAHVVGWDPVATGPIAGVEAASSPEAAVVEADAILAFTTAAHSAEALSAVTGTAQPGAIYADFSTAPAGVKRSLWQVANGVGLRFVDAAIMAPVRRGADAAPILLAGDSAPQLGTQLQADGLRVEVLDGDPGSAAARKLLRSMLVKGLTGVMIESLRAAEQEGLLEWFSNHLVETLTTLQPQVLSGFIKGTRHHALRRIDEMVAAAEMAESAGGTAGITRATADLLRTVPGNGIPAAGALA